MPSTLIPEVRSRNHNGVIKENGTVPAFYEKIIGRISLISLSAEVLGNTKGVKL